MFGWCEVVPTEAPLEGELAAQLTEGSRLGLWPSLAPEAQIPGFLNIRVCIPPPAAAFLKKSRTPQTRLSPGQLPFQGSLWLVAASTVLCKLCIGISSYNLKNLLIENGGRVW